MIELSDEILCRYLDKELDAAATNEVEKALALDAGARVRLQRMRDADTVLRSAIPEHTLANDPLVSFIRSGGKVMDGISASNDQYQSNRHSVMWGSLVAGILGLIVGALAMRNIAGGAAMETSLANITMDTNRSLSLALNTIKSGATLQRNDDTLQMVLSFNAKDGRHCRVFDVTNSSGSSEGVACRNDKQWQVVAWDASQSKADGYRMAGGNELIDNVMNRLGGNAALELNDEQKLIDSKWR
jgi:hypothetical protein